MSTFSKNQNFECAPIRTPSVMMERTVKWNPSKKIESAPNCPRCASSKTKFCYYNNYSISQPRYFCKSCRRYWTKGGSLRNVPVGGGCRKGRRLHTPASTQHGGASTTSTTSTTANESAEREGTDSSNNTVLEYEKEMDWMSGGDDRLHECFDGQDFVYKNDELENILGTDHNLLWSDEGTSNLPSFGFQEDFDLLSNIGDDDQLTISPNNNLVISDNWGLIDNADWL